MDQFFAAVTAQATSVVEGMGPQINKHFEFIQSDFSLSAEAARAAIEKEISAAAANSRMSGLVMKVLDMLVQDIEALGTLKRWITLSIPKIEDGNNFGVDVQMQLVKHVDEQMKVLVTMRDSLADYSKDRAAALEKVLPTVTKKSEKSKKTSSSSGSAVKEDAQGESVTVSTGEDESISTPTVLPDNTEFVVQTELKWYFKLKDAAVTGMDIMMVVLDIVTKNREKIENPRGSSGGSSGFAAMY